MDFEYSPKALALRQRLLAFVAEHIYPHEATFHAEIRRDRWKVPPIVEELKSAARAAGLWNLFLPESE